MRIATYILCLLFGWNCTDKTDTKGPLDGQDGSPGIVQGEDGEDGKDAN
jgi:hypothetical protein